MVLSSKRDELRLALPELMELAVEEECEVVRALAGLFVAAARCRSRCELREAA